MIHLKRPAMATVAATAIVVACAMAMAGCTATQSPADSTSAAQGSTSATVGPTSAATSGTGASVPASPDAVAQPAPTDRTVPVPAPSGGTIYQVVPSATAGPVTKVDMKDTAKLPGNVSISITKAEAIQTKATTPGEIAGPALAMFVSIHNGSEQKVNVDSAILALTNSNNQLGQPTTSDPYQPFSGELAPGASAEGIYVFLLPTNARDGLTLSVEYAAGQASAQFVGDIS